ncbi:MAG: translation elongation factor Ts [Verrucomicrobia bacterium]|nr:MAG: translation elongation factor Ts [Verrucomicrobiota bacterium]
MITAATVKELRDKTNAGMMDCKRALEETNGDLDAAITLLREKGIAKAAKKADREANEGTITARIAADGKSGILLEVNCETDFVSKNENFQGFVAADLAAANAVVSNGLSIEDTIKAKITEIGENMLFRKYVRFEAQGEGAIASYIHMGGKVGVLVEVGTTNAATAATEGFRDLIKDITLHIAALNPRGLAREDISAEVVAAEEAIFRAQMLEQGKPEAMLDKILPGMMKKFFAENCLLEQGFVKDPSITVKGLLEAKGKELGDTLTLRRYVRFGLGE